MATAADYTEVHEYVSFAGSTLTGIMRVLLHQSVDLLVVLETLSAHCGTSCEALIEGAETIVGWWSDHLQEKRKHARHTYIQLIS